MNLDRAILLAVTAHSGQVDKGGAPYILHPLRVMFRLPTESLKIIAVLHDVIEDSMTSLDDLRREGFSEEVVNSLDALTRRPEEEYNLFIKRISFDLNAIEVKIVDIMDNLDVSRMANPLSEMDLKRLQKYHNALNMLRKIEAAGI